MTDDASRKAFEEWAKPRLSGLSYVWDTEDGRYLHNETQASWCTWLASRTAAIVESAEVIEEAERTLAAYEKWEADIIINGDWSSTYVCLTQELHERMVELQEMRNAALAAIRALKSGKGEG